MDEPGDFWSEPPTSYAACDHVSGPFWHGTSAHLDPGDELVVGHESHFESGRRLHHVYFTTRLETAAWGAELATALAHRGPAARRGRIYVVEPTGPFEDDPNVTDQKFPGNPTRSFRTTHPLRVVGEVDDWTGHPPEQVQGMLDGLARLRAEGRDVILD